jgi:hypothetical protein
MLEFDDAPKGLARLIYASRSPSPGPGFSEDVRAILLKSIHNNRMAAITGFLVTGEGRFLQVLEGPVAEVEATAERRLFRDWNMAQHQLVAADQGALNQAGLDGFTPDRLDPERAIWLLKKFGALYLR